MHSSEHPIEHTLPVHKVPTGTARKLQCLCVHTFGLSDNVSSITPWQLQVAVVAAAAVLRLVEWCFTAVAWQQL
jgi:hypothetical protein